MNTIDMYEEDPLAPKCESCEVPLKDHLGLTGTCKQLQEANKRIAELEAELSQYRPNDRLLEGHVWVMCPKEFIEQPPKEVE